MAARAACCRLRRNDLIQLPQVEPGNALPTLVVRPLSRRKSSGEIQRILIATKFRFIGDTLLAIPIFRAARAQWPDAHIALLTGKNARVLLQNNPYLDEIVSSLTRTSRTRGDAGVSELGPTAARAEPL